MAMQGIKVGERRGSDWGEGGVPTNDSGGGFANGNAVSSKMT